MTKPTTAEGEFQAAVKKVEDDSRRELIEKMVQDQAMRIVKDVMTRDSENMNKRIYEMVESMVELNIEEIVTKALRKVIDEKFQELGGSFLMRLEELDIGK